MTRRRSHPKQRRRDGIVARHATAIRVHPTEVELCLRVAVTRGVAVQRRRLERVPGHAFAVLVRKRLEDQARGRIALGLRTEGWTRAGRSGRKHKPPGNDPIRANGADWVWSVRPRRRCRPRVYPVAEIARRFVGPRHSTAKGTRCGSEMVARADSRIANDPSSRVPKWLSLKSGFA